MGNGNLGTPFRIDTSMIFSLVRMATWSPGGHELEYKGKNKDLGAVITPLLGDPVWAGSTWPTIGS